MTRKYSIIEMKILQKELDADKFQEIIKQQYALNVQKYIQEEKEYQEHMKEYDKLISSTET
jgi:hypothetical protein